MKVRRKSRLLLMNGLKFLKTGCSTVAGIRYGIPGLLAILLSFFVFVSVFLSAFCLCVSLGFLPYLFLVYIHVYVCHQVID